MRFDCTKNGYEHPFWLDKGFNQQHQLTSWLGWRDDGAVGEQGWIETWWWCTWSPEPTTLQPKRQQGQHKPTTVNPLTVAEETSVSEQVLPLPLWIRNVGGLVSLRLEKMTWCVIEAQHCCTSKLCCDVCAFTVYDSGIHCIISNELQLPTDLTAPLESLLQIMSQPLTTLLLICQNLLAHLPLIPPNSHLVLHTPVPIQILSVDCLMHLSVCSPCSRGFTLQYFQLGA